MPPTRSGPGEHSAPAAVLFGVLAASTVALSLGAANGRPILGGDTALLLAGALVLVGAPAGLGFWLACRLARRLGCDRSGAVRVSAALALAGLLALVAHGAVLADTHRPVLPEQHLPPALFLFWLGAAPGHWRGTARRALAVAGFLLVLGAALGAQRSGLRPPSAVAIPAAVARVTPPARVLILGVDGLGFDVVQRLERLRPSADWCWLSERLRLLPLASLEPTLSPLIWTTIATGRPPESHGVWTFTSLDLDGLARPLQQVPSSLAAFYWKPLAVRLDVARVQPLSSLDSRCPPFWEILAAAGLPVDVVGWWGTWPAPAIQGRVVSDKFFFYRDARQGRRPVARSGIVHPEALARAIAPLLRSPDSLGAGEIRRFLRLDDAEASALAARPYEHHQVLSELPLALAMDETYYAIAERLLESAAPDVVAAFYFRGVDIVSHAALAFSELYPEAAASVTASERARYGETVSAYYHYTFSRLRRLVERAGPDTAVIIVSDHGFDVDGRGANHDHAPPGVLLAGIPGSPGRAPEHEASVYDVAPTVLWLAGQPAARDMPGRALRSLFPHLAGEARLPRLATYGGRRPGPADGIEHTPGADSRMMDLLETLGYVN